MRSGLGAFPAPLGLCCRGRRRGPPPAALVVGRTLRGMVWAVEAEERREEQGVAEVAHSLVCAAAAGAAWEEGGRLGEQPAFGLLPLPDLAAGPGQSAGGGSGALPRPTDMSHVVRFASSIAAGLFGGGLPAAGGTVASSMGVATAEVTAATCALLQQLRLPGEAALRQAALLAAMPAVAAATRAATAAVASPGSPASGSPLPASALGRVQVAASQQGIVAFLASTLLQCKQLPLGAVIQHGGPSVTAAAAPAVQPAFPAAVYALAPLPPQPAWDAPLPAAYQPQGSSSAAAGKGSNGCGRGEAARAGSLHPCPGSAGGGPAGSGAAASRGQPALGRCLTVGRAPAAVCFHCCTGVAQEGEAAGPCAHVQHAAPALGACKHAFGIVCAF